RLDVHDLDDPRIHPVERNVAAGFEEDRPAGFEESLHQRIDAFLLERLAAGHFDEVRAHRESLAGGLLDAHLLPAVERVRRVAPDAAQRAPRQPDERAGKPGAYPLSLDRAENLGDTDRVFHALIVFTETIQSVFTARL